MTKPLFEKRLADAAELLIYNKNGDSFAISLEPWQIDAIQIILGFNYTNGNLAMFTKESVCKFLEKTGIQNLSMVVNDEYTR